MKWSSLPFCTESFIWDLLFVNFIVVILKKIAGTLPYMWSGKKINECIEVYVIDLFIIWLAPWAGKMNQIARYDWLPEWVRWSSIARSGLPAVSREKNFPESQIIKVFIDQAFSVKMAGCWPYSGFFFLVYGPRRKKGTWPTSRHLDSRLVQTPYLHNTATPLQNPFLFYRVTLPALSSRALGG